MLNWKQLIISQSATILNAMQQIDSIGFSEGILFVVNDEEKLIGTLTDGDIRRGLLNHKQTTDTVLNVVNANCTKLIQNQKISTELKAFCLEKQIEAIPIVDANNVIVNIVSYNDLITQIPVQAIIMAGGRGERLKPLTDTTPKPLLVIGTKPIIEHNIDRLKNVGVQNIAISISYLGNLIQNYFDDGAAKKINISYIEEDKPMGTLGAVSNFNNWIEEDILVMNSDLLTNIDFTDFYNNFKTSNADVAVATIPYKVDLPYAIMELQNDVVTGLVEKPTYTYYANAGIYLVKKQHLLNIPKNTFYNATDLIEAVVANGGKVTSFPILGYWLDIGKKNDFEKAKEDIKHIKL